MEKLTSLSILVGTGECNGNCGFCAGRDLRKYAPKKDGEFNESLVRKTLEDCAKRGARYLSLSSSGEPTLSPLSVTNVLGFVSDLKGKGIVYFPVNLYSNGIRMGEDEQFCENYLKLWKSLGLTNIYVTLHDITSEGNARVYRIKNYPSIETIFSRIHAADIKIRTNLVLSKGAVDSFDKFVMAFDYLRKIGTDAISTWPLRDKNDMIDLELSPEQTQLEKINKFVTESKNTNLTMVYEQFPTHYHSSKKLTLFPNGLLASSWCNR
jgi:molybdenum cofactor biosynthesis enzyme MoaA